jgi:hypothetical protein
MLYIMRKSKRQVKRRMGTKKRRVVRRKTQKRKQTKRKGGDLFKRPEFGREQTFKLPPTSVAVPDQVGVLQTSADTTLGDYGSELGSEPNQERKSSLSFSNPFSRPSTPLPDPETIIVGLDDMIPSEIDKMIASIKRFPETEVLNNKLKQLQDRKAKLESIPSVSFETKKRGSSFGLPFFKR